MATDLSRPREAEVEDLVPGVRPEMGRHPQKASAGRKATIKAIQKSGIHRQCHKTIKTANTRRLKVQKAKSRPMTNESPEDRRQRKEEAKARKFRDRGYKKISDSELQSQLSGAEKRYRELKAIATEESLRVIDRSPRTL